MARPVVLCTRKFPPAVEARLARDYDARLDVDDRVIDGSELLKLAEGCDALMIASSTKLTAQAIGALPKSVKIAASFAVGYEHVDVAAAKKRGLIVTNTPEVLTDATAEIAMLCILGAARRAWEAEHMVRTGNWKGWATTQLLGVGLNGKRLGIYGMGRIGQGVAKRARGFDMTIHYCNRTRLSPDLELGATYHARIDDMLPHCDVLSINAPASPETHHFLNAERIARMPDGAIVVNTARGTLVDDTALISALRSGKVRAAGLDVFENEPNLNKEYLTVENAFLLPHIGSATVETRDAMGFRCLDNLDAYFAGREPPHRVA
ncbi:MAG: D-glycerate dehydrogenase [Alphaproteobacteria bacterium]|nr:D-glycerate dehydrogenase [Alphaproteobacteria bacterium]